MEERNPIAPLQYICNANAHCMSFLSWGFAWLACTFASDSRHQRSSPRDIAVLSATLLTVVGELACSADSSSEGMQMLYLRRSSSAAQEALPAHVRADTNPPRRARWSGEACTCATHRGRITSQREAVSKLCSQRPLPMSRPVLRKLLCN